VPDPYELAWRELEARWTEEAAHRRFIAFCAAQGALAEAGRRYRELRERDPARSEEAKRRLDAVLSAAMQSMELARTHKPPKPKRMHWVIVGMCAFLVIYGVLSILRARSQ